MQTATYDPAVARAFFMSAGTPADIAEGKKIFGEKERAIPASAHCARQVWFRPPALDQPLFRERTDVLLPCAGANAARVSREAP